MKINRKGCVCWQSIAEIHLDRSPQELPIEEMTGLYLACCEWAKIQVRTNRKAKFALRIWAKSEEDAVYIRNRIVTHFGMYPIIKDGYNEIWLNQLGGVQVVGNSTTIILDAMDYKSPIIMEPKTVEKIVEKIVEVPGSTNPAVNRFDVVGFLKEFAESPDPVTTCPQKPFGEDGQMLRARQFQRIIDQTPEYAGWVAMVRKGTVYIYKEV